MNKLKIACINARGLRNEEKRRNLLRQVKSHCDCVLIQETYADEKLSRVIKNEFPGQCAFSHNTTRSAGVAIGIFGFGIKMAEEHEHVSNDGRLLGKLVIVNKQPFYILSIYAPCCDTSRATRANNLQVLRQAQNLMVCQRALGHTIILGGDLNFINIRGI